MSDTPEKPKPTHVLHVKYTTGAESTHALRMHNTGFGPDTVFKVDEFDDEAGDSGDAMQIDYAHGGRTWIQKRYVLSYQLSPWREVKKAEDATIAAMRTSAERHRTAAQTPQEDVPDGLPKGEVG